MLRSYVLQFYVWTRWVCNLPYQVFSDLTNIYIDNTFCRVDEMIIFMLYLCYIYVIFMLYLCYIYVIFMLYLCYIYVIFMLYLTIYKARRYIFIYIYIYPHHFTDTTASTLTRVSAKTVQDIKLKLF